MTSVTDLQIPHGNVRRLCQIHLSGAQWKGKRQWAQTQIQVIPFELQKKFFCWLNTGTGWS